METADGPLSMSAAPPRFTKISGSNAAHRVHALHQGKGAIDVHRFAFHHDRQMPYFVMFDMPPGSTEGSHAHGAENVAETWLDEYYYVISVSGIMRIDGEIVDVSQGDFIYTPAGASHGIENTAEHGQLIVMLTVISVPPA